jgi:2-polyprenyl-6-methoxyphenol hydroxylase-like FAD-dependent oxidoreductase
MKPTQNPDRKHAIVIGGSMAGLLAARVLSDYYLEVTIIERDPFPSEVTQRRSVPQGRHTHGLLAGGRDALEVLFPGFSKALVERGAVTGDLARDCRWFFAGDCLSRPVSGMNGLLLTRPMIEAAVRERVLALTNVRRLDNATVQSILESPGAGRVTGVQIGNDRLIGDLVVDATGRGSHTPQWLERMGYEKPEEDVVQVALGYTTRFFRRQPNDLDGDVAAIIPPTPEGKRGGVMLAQEGDRWTVTLITHFGSCAPEDLHGFVEFARTLPAPYIHEVVRNADPIGEAATARFSASVRRRYERLSRLPGGYLVLGDAMCSFNPIYGQGMSVAALEALELDKVLASGSSDLARSFFARAAKVVDIPWSIAVGNDLRMPETVGPRSTSGKFINWYISKLHRAAHGDSMPALAFLKVNNLIAPPSSLMHPRVASRVLLSHLTASSKEKAPYPGLRSHQKETTARRATARRHSLLD